MSAVIAHVVAVVVAVLFLALTSEVHQTACQALEPGVWRSFWLSLTPAILAIAAALLAGYGVGLLGLLG